jgi:hypothetical protein
MHVVTCNYICTRGVIHALLVHTMASIQSTLGWGPHIRPPTPMYLGLMHLLCIGSILIISLYTTTFSLTITDHQLERDLALSILSPSSSSSPLTMWRRQIWSPFFPYYGLLWLYICAYIYDCKQWNMSRDSKAVILLQTFPLHLLRQ